MRAAESTISDVDLDPVTITALPQPAGPWVVIATPACESRLCGPINDAVAAVAGRNRRPDGFRAPPRCGGTRTPGASNAAAAEWIAQNGADGNEPWVFVIGADGVVRFRFDNVANEDQIDAAVQQVSP